MSASADIFGRPNDCRVLGRYAPPEPMPIMKRPPVISLKVPPLMAKAIGVRCMTGETAMPVVSPPATTSLVALHL